MKISLTKLAEQKLDDIIKYLEAEWPAPVKNKFLKILQSKFKLICSNPNLGVASDLKPNLRKLVVTKQCSAYYTVKKDIIFIITIFDTRQSPESLFDEIIKHDI